MKDFVNDISNWSTAILVGISLVIGVLIDNLFLNQKAKRLIKKSEEIVSAWEELKAERDELKTLAESEAERANAEKRYSTQLKRQLTLALRDNKELADHLQKFKDTTELLLEENEKIMNSYLDVKRDMDTLKSEMEQLKK